MCYRLRHNASCAEPQLIAYFFFSKHCFLLGEVRRRQSNVDVAQRDFDGPQRRGEAFRVAEERSEGPLRRLASVRPPVMMRQATILTSKAPCPKCAAFGTAVNVALGISVVLQQFPMLE
jgi:hypothetical protein